MTTSRVGFPRPIVKPAGRPLRAAACRRSGAARALRLALISPLLGGCLSLQAAPPSTSTPLPEPSLTPTFAFPTLPASRTPTAALPLTPTPDPLAQLGEVLYLEGFAADSPWPVRQSEQTSTSLSNGRLAIVVGQPRTFFTTASPFLPPLSFFLEVRARVELCSPGDEYGLMLRLAPNGNHYRITLTCDGGARVTRVLGDSSIALVPVTETFLVLPGAPADNRIAVLAEGDRYRFYLNGREAFSVRDDSLTGGGIGLFAHTAGAGQLTLSFDDLLVRALAPASSGPSSTTPTLP